ncbi:MAG: hypothetical protein WBA77_11595 [Microcoleaceae cyanobacterium]
MSNNNYPKAWSRFFSENRESDSILPEDLVNNFAQLSRWSAWFRLAKSFKGLDLGDTYSGVDTPQLYSAITRIFLVYSAFETYCYIIGLKPNKESQIKFIQNAQSQEEIIKAIRDLDPSNNISNFLEQHSTGKDIKQMMCDFKAGDDINVSCFARSIRHVFAHGILSANSTGLSPKRFNQLSLIISNFLLDCMDEDFDRRIPFQ